MITQGGHEYRSAGSHSENILIALPALLFPICAALRLARFNTEDDSTGDFRGLSTPAATATVIGSVLIVIHDPAWVASHPISNLDFSILSIYSCCLILPALMVSKISMFSLKFNGISWRNNELRYTFILLFFILLFVFREKSILVIMVLYILTNIILHFYRKLMA